MSEAEELSCENVEVAEAMNKIQVDLMQCRDDMEKVSCEFKALRKEVIAQLKRDGKKFDTHVYLDVRLWVGKVLAIPRATWFHEPVIERRGSRVTRGFAIPVRLRDGDGKGYPLRILYAHAHRNERTAIKEAEDALRVIREKVRGLRNEGLRLHSRKI